jgi:PAS domain-containing protein
MSNSPRARVHPEAEDSNSPPLDSTASVAVSAVRAAAFACPEEHASLHHLLRRQERDAHLPTNAGTPEVRALLKLVSEHYEAIDEERRGIVKSMRLMADEARALAREVHEQSSEHLQVILDHIKDVVLTLDEAGRIRTFNPTAEQVFAMTRLKSSAGASITWIRTSRRTKQSPRRCSAWRRIRATR